MLTSSFGAQAAVSLHLVTQVDPDIPVVLVDTGYLFPETYRFVDDLTARLKINLKVYRAELSPAWQEARYGQRWNQGPRGPRRVQRREQGRADAPRAARARREHLVRGPAPQPDREPREDRVPRSGPSGRWKVHPIADWTDRDVHRYLTKHNLPYHPLWEKGYVSIGDHHSTKPIHEVATAEQTRFFGLKRECGIHEINLADL